MTRPRAILAATLALIACAAISALTPRATAQPPSDSPPPPDTSTTESRRAQKQALGSQWLAAYQARRYDEAERVLKQLIELEPAEYVPVYNLACVQALAGRIPEAEASLKAAVELGFIDFDQMQRDASLVPLHNTHTYRALLVAWPVIQDRNINARIERYRNSFARTYTFVKDDDLRLAYASGFAESSFASARAEIARLAGWWKTHVLPEGETAVSTDAKHPDPWVLVVFPTRRDYDIWAAKNFGSRAANVGGIYDNDKKELVARDLGSSMRHEFLHVLHWRHMNRTGRVQPVWIQEGLCSLVEDVDLVPGPDGEPTYKPIPSWRTNQVRRMSVTGTLPKWSQLFTTSADAFVAKRPLANYAVARSIFLYIDEQGKLRDWYAAYMKTFDEDPSSGKAMELVFAKPLAQIEKDWRAWVAKLPEVHDASHPADTALPVELEEIGGDGLTITAVLPAARDADLRLGDIITAINGHPIRDLNDYAHVMTDLKAGAQVEVAYRRVKLTGTTRITAIPRPDQ